jgi:hypothetical protein
MEHRAQETAFPQVSDQFVPFLFPGFMSAPEATDVAA